MRTWILCVFMTAALACGAPGAQAAKGDSWPDTNAGRVARGWTEAFSAGEPAMRKYLASAMSPESLKKKPLDERMETYRTSRDQLGKLAFGSVVKSKPAELAVKLIDEAGKSHEFTFVVESASPYRLVSVSRKQNVFHPGFGGLHH